MNLNTLLVSKFFWITVSICFVAYAAYTMGHSDAQPWTAKDEQNAVKECQRWSGKAVYNNSGEYLGCDSGHGLDE